MTRRTKTAALLVAASACAAGCAQVFGLGDYGPLPEDAGPDVTVAGDAGRPGDSGGTSDGPMHTDSAADAARGDTGSMDAGPEAPVFAADACAGGNTCAPAAPANWHGPLALWEGTGSPVPCTGYYLPYFDGGSALGTVSGAQCDCSCGPPSGSTCGGVTVQFGAGGCSSSCGSVSIGNTGCAGVQTIAAGCGSTPMFSVTGSAGAGGNCQPDASVTLPPVTWTNQVVACSPNGQSPNGCPSGETCVPVAPSAFGTRFCILSPGMNSCPPGVYTVQHIYYGGISDTRGCAACTCGSATGVDCNSNGHLTTWGNPNCSASAGADLNPVPVTCTPVGSAHSMKFSTTPTGGSCAPSGGQPMGSASAQDVTTVCCTQ